MEYALISAILLGIYDIVSKKALKDNMVLSVNTVLTFTAALCVLLINKVNFQLDIRILIILIIKSLIIIVSWLLANMALKELPISFISPFKLLNSIWALLLGIIFLNQFLNLTQILIFIIILMLFYFLTKTEVVYKKYFKNKNFVFFIIAGMLASISALIDKILLIDVEIATIQFYFYSFVAIGYFIIGLFSRQNYKFVWNTRMLYACLAGVLLTFGDIFYFSAMKFTTINIGFIILVKRFSVIVSAVFGGLIFKEEQLFRKLIYIVLILSMFYLISK